MCGLSGIVGGSDDIARAVLPLMVDGQHRRGPDARATTFLTGAALGHNRLAVLDLSASANQPFSTPGGHVHLVYNGELYNYRELRADLQRAGRSFRTTGDTEVVLAAFEHWGEDCVTRFNGMFAFAIWNERARQLFLARDRFGEKPLFYAYTRDGLVFASEPSIPALHPEVGRVLDQRGLACQLAIGYTTGEPTLFRGVLRLPPATTAWYEPGGQLRVRRYWDLPGAFANKLPNPDFDECAEQLRALIDDAVRMRMIADVPLGAFLSGGIDSSTIAAAMRSASPDTRTFSVGFASGSFDERRHAREVAAALGTLHTERELAPGAEFVQALAEAAREPIADTSFLPMLLLARTTRESVTVALSGDGADEALLGYPTHAADQLHRRIAPWLRPFERPIRRLVDVMPARFTKVSLDYRARQFASGLALDPTDAHYHWREILSADERARLVPELAGDRTALDIFRDKAADVADRDLLDRASYVDLTTWLPDDILVKVDRATMAHSLEARAPFLDHRLIEYVASLPVGFRFAGGRGKRILRRSQRSRLPRNTLQRAKRGFKAPVSEWLNGEMRTLADETLNDARLRSTIEGAAIDELLAAHRRGEREPGLKLLNLMMLSLWLNR
jgi:asparagine synthase (glutamine-hydrolysing)